MSEPPPLPTNPQTTPEPLGPTPSQNVPEPMDSSGMGSSDITNQAANGDIGSIITGMLPDLSFGAIVGLGTGMAFKFIGKIALITVGLIYILLQFLAWSEVINIDWIKIQAISDPWLKRGSEEGGNWLMRVLTHNVPFAGAFIGGFLLGLRRG